MPMFTAAVIDYETHIFAIQMVIQTNSYYVNKHSVRGCESKELALPSKWQGISLSPLNLRSLVETSQSGNYILLSIFYKWTHAAYTVPILLVPRSLG